ncbi:MAG: DNRLRE domain-containing protein [Candidatus Kryptoniota bacterium]
MENKYFGRLFLIAVVAISASGCTNKINQYGSWLVNVDSTTVPRSFDSVVDSGLTISQQIIHPLATGSSTVLTLGKLPWVESDLLIQFHGLDSVYNASSIIKAWITFRRASYVLPVTPQDTNSLKQLTFSGYALNGNWTATGATWDSIKSIGYEYVNRISSSAVTDTTVVLNLDTSIVRTWGRSGVDSTVKSYGIIIIPQFEGGILSVYSAVNGTSAYDPFITVIYQKNGTTDTLTSIRSLNESVSNAYLNNLPQGKFKYIEGGTGLRMWLKFDLSKIPKHSIVNYATLTLTADFSDTSRYGTKSIDSLVVYYDSTSTAFNAFNPVISSLSGNRYTFNVTLLVQMMLNGQNNGFMVTKYSELNNVDTRFIYDETAPDSLKPKLNIIYTPAGTK